MRLIYFITILLLLESCSYQKKIERLARKGNVYALHQLYLYRKMNDSIKIHYLDIGINLKQIDNPPNDADNNRPEFYLYKSILVKDTLQKIQNLRYAAALKHPQANFHLGEAFYDGQNKLLTYNIDSALYYFNIASEMDFSYATKTIGDIFYLGKKGKEDMKKALNFYKRACLSDINRGWYYGNEAACDSVSNILRKTDSIDSNIYYERARKINKKFNLGGH